MASDLFNPSFTTALILILLSVLYSLSFAEDSSTICASTPHYSFCESVLRNNNPSANVHDDARFSVAKSLSVEREILHNITEYIRKPSGLTLTAIRALQDCRFLSQRNIDFLSSSFRTLNSATTILPRSKADDVHACLSAALTNLQTCLGGLQATAAFGSEKNGLCAFLSNNTLLHSVSLALFTKGWVHHEKTVPSNPIKRQLAFRNGRWPIKMSPRNQAIYERVSRRKLLQINGNQLQVNQIVTVSQDGSGNFTTINGALAAAPNTTDASGFTGYFLIHVKTGVYQEYIWMDTNKRYIMMIGDGINKTVITGNHNVADGWTTYSSPTFGVFGQGFVAVNMTFCNTAGAIKGQAVAVLNGADLSTFYRCSFEGYQDTLWSQVLRQFYRECDIYGTVDFIFGNSAAVFQNCNIYPRLPLSYQFNVITAQGKSDPNQNTGTSFQNCVITPAADLASSNSNIQTYLGRPWQEYSTTVYMESFMDSFINPQGWHEWSGTYALNTLYYAEFNNMGPGSNTAGRVTWPGYHVINSTSATSFTVSNFISGDSWLPVTGVSYTSGL